MGPFALALDALFMAPGSAEAIYTPKGAPPRTDPIRVIRSRPDVTAAFGETSVILGTNIFDLRRSEVAMPAKGDTLTIGLDVFRLLGEAMIDVEGLTWSIGAEPVA